MIKVTINWNIRGRDGTLFDTSRTMDYPCFPVAGMLFYTESDAGNLPIESVTLYPDGRVHVQLQDYVLENQQAVNDFVATFNEYSWQ